MCNVTVDYQNDELTNNVNNGIICVYVSYYSLEIIALHSISPLYSHSQTGSLVHYMV